MARRSSRLRTGEVARSPVLSARLRLLRLFFPQNGVARDSAELACLEVLERLYEFGSGVHDERSVCGDRLADGEPSEKDDF